MRFLIILTGILWILNPIKVAATDGLSSLKQTIEEIENNSPSSYSIDELIIEFHRELKEMFKIPIDLDTSLKPKILYPNGHKVLVSNFLNSLDREHFGLSLYLPTIDSALTVNHIEWEAEVYLCDLILSLLDSSCANKALPISTTKSSDFNKNPIHYARNNGGEILVTLIELDDCHKNIFLERGDRIISINQIPSTFLTNGIIFSELHYRDSINIEFIRDGLPISKTLKFPAKVPFNSKEYSYELIDDRIGLVTIKNSIFKMETVTQIRNKLISEKKKLSKIILDVRNCHGGDISPIKGLLELFFDKRESLFEINLPKENNNITVTSDNRQIRKEIVLRVLANKFTSSGANIICAVVQDKQRGIVIGETTNPAGALQKRAIIRGTSDILIYYPLGSYNLSKNRTINLINPDVFIPDCSSDGKDKILEYAKEN
ncbi:MAG: S41 family peptidase [Luteibaculum sp.]